MNKPFTSIPLRLTGLALALLAAYPAMAQSQDQAQGHDHAATPPQAEPQPDANVPTLPQVTVRSSQLSAPVSEVYDSKRSDVFQATSDGADYLRAIPGFSAIRSGGANGDPVLRGMFGSRLNILNDGASMIGACPARMDATSSYIAPESFDAMTVIKGPQSVIWGPGASAGTVKFDRDTPRFVMPGVHFDGSLGPGSFSRSDEAADLTAGNEKFYARITASHTHSGDYKDGSGNTIPSAWDKYNADVALGFTPDANTRFELTAGQGDGHVKYAGRGMDATQLKRQSLGARFVKDHIGDTLQKIEAQLYYNDATMVMDNFTYRPVSASGGGMGGGMGSGGCNCMGGGMGGMSNMLMDMEDQRTTRGGRLAATWNLGAAFDLVTGVDAQASRHAERMAMSMNGTPVSRTDYPSLKDATLGNVGLFAQSTWRATEHDRVVGGLRLDRAWAKDWRQTLPKGMMGMMTMPNPTAGQSRDKTLPSGFIRYEQDLAATPATWYAGIGHVERFPDYWELFSAKNGQWGPTMGQTTAFGSVQPEKTTQIDIGARYKTQQLELWASGYLGYVRDFILFKYTTNGMGSSMAAASNVNASIWGGELGASYRITPQWRAGATLATAWGENRTDGSALPQMPPLEARLNVSWQNGPWAAGALWRLVTAQNRIAAGQGNVVGQDFGKSAGFGTLSLNASYAFDKRTRLILGVDNLLNKTYSEHLNTAGNAGFGFAANTPVNEPGRTLWVKLNARF